MVDMLKAIQAAAPTQSTGGIESLNKSQNSSTDFGKILEAGMKSVNENINESETKSQEFLTEGKHDLHEVMLSLEKADLSFRYLSQVRNKVLDAYHEIMRMQV